MKRIFYLLVLFPLLSISQVTGGIETVTPLRVKYPAAADDRLQDVATVTDLANIHDKFNSMVVKVADTGSFYTYVQATNSWSKLVDYLFSSTDNIQLNGTLYGKNAVFNSGAPALSNSYAWGVHNNYWASIASSRSIASVIQPLSASLGQRFTAFDGITDFAFINPVTGNFLFGDGATGLGLIGDNGSHQFKKDISMTGTPTKSVDNYSKVVRDEATGYYKYLSLQNAENFSDKYRSATTFSVACEGTSLTYGQNTISGTAAAINGATQLRNVNAAPETLQAVLTIAGITATVTNRGYPGDRTSEALSRWANATAVDVVFLEYGTNDANNYANYNGGGSLGYLSVAQFKKNYRQLIQRRLNQGSWVILQIPPSLKDDASNARLNTYVNAIYDLAKEYSCPVVDVQRQVRWINNGDIWVDGVHHLNIVSDEWGSHLAYFLLNKGANNTEVYANDRFSPNSKLLTSPNNPTVNANATYGNLIYLGTGFKKTITIDVKQRCQMYVKTISPSATRKIDFYYGDGITKPMITVSNAATVVTPVRTNLFILEPGIRTITVSNPYPSTVAFIDEIGFDPIDVQISGQATASNGTTPQSLITLSQLQAATPQMFAVNPTTTGLSSAQLNTQYPDVGVSFRVLCGSIMMGGAIYTKYSENGTSDVWLIESAPVVP